MQDQYADLLIKYRPQIVVNSTEYRQLRSNIQELVVKPSLTEAEDRMLELLATIETRYLEEIKGEKDRLRLESELT